MQSLATGEIAELTTDEHGFFSAIDLAPGLYRIRLGGDIYDVRLFSVTCELALVEAGEQARVEVRYYRSACDVNAFLNSRLVDPNATSDVYRI